MPQEIEHKFLITTDAWRAAVRSSTRIRQGYFISDGVRSVRVRTRGVEGWLTIKSGARFIDGVTQRAEFEYAIPFTDAEYMLDHLCTQPLVEKIRHEIVHIGMLWEVDEFLGMNDGLLLAEIEVDDAQQHFERPAWIGHEVSDDPRYFNSYIGKHPGFWRTSNM